MLCIPFDCCPDPADTETQTGPGVGMIAGIISGAFVLVSVVTFVALLRWQRWRQKLTQTYYVSERLTPDLRAKQPLSDVRILLKSIGEDPFDDPMVSELQEMLEETLSDQSAVYIIENTNQAATSL